MQTVEPFIRTGEAAGFLVVGGQRQRPHAKQLRVYALNRNVAKPHISKPGRIDLLSVFAYVAEFCFGRSQRRCIQLVPVQHLRMTDGNDLSPPPFQLQLHDSGKILAEIIDRFPIAVFKMGNGMQNLPADNVAVFQCDLRVERKPRGIRMLPADCFQPSGGIVDFSVIQASFPIVALKRYLPTAVGNDAFRCTVGVLYK